MGGDGSNEGRTPKATDVLLPGENWVLQSWKAEPGSLVRKGETVALACPKGSAAEVSSASAPTVAPPASASGHKRPNRRRRAAPQPAATFDNKAAHQSLSKATSNNNAIASIQQRIAEKLSSEKAAASKCAADQSALSSGESKEEETATTSSAKVDSSRSLLAPATGLLRCTTSPGSSDHPSIAIGYIEECLHPAFLEGICVVCGDSVVNQDDDETNNSPSVLLPSTSPNSDESPKTSQVTVSGGVTMTISEEESRKMAQQDTERLLQQAKLSLVLDLDHTLVHATADPRAQQFHEKDDVRTLRLPIMEDMPHLHSMPPGTPMFMQHYVKLRPHIKTFLQTVQPDYELTVYTAGTRQYAEEIAIVLSRHMVGSTRDIDELERLRFEVHRAEIEFQKVQSLNQEIEELGAAAREETTKRKADEAIPIGDEKDDQPVKKRKKVSFGISEGNASDGEENANGEVAFEAPASGNHQSDHMTGEKLEMLRQELAGAEELEIKAWEMRKKLFGSRVVSRTDVGDLGRDVKSLKRIFPCGGTMAAVVDDREDVWANASDNSTNTIKGEPPANLLLVRPYHWKPFIGFADVNNAAGEDLSGDRDNNNEDPNVETDVQLVWTSRILKGLHRRYYRQELNNRKTVPELLAQMRSQVLKDAKMVLSGLVPLHKKDVGANKARPPIIRYAHSLGATLLDNVQAGVTHLVAAKDGTDKCLAARKTPGCTLVKAGWLLECYWSMTLRDVKPYLLNGEEGLKSAPTPASRQPPQKSQIDNSSSADASDTSSTGSQEDDDFAASLEDEMMNS